MAQSTNLTVGQGETFKVLVTIQDDTGASIDVSDQHFTGSVRQTYSSEDTSASFAFEKITPNSSGSLYMSLAPASTATLSSQDYVYDVLMTSESVTRRIIEGKFIVRPSVTR